MALAADVPTPEDHFAAALTDPEVVARIDRQLILPSDRFLDPHNDDVITRVGSDALYLATFSPEEVHLSSSDDSLKERTTRFHRRDDGGGSTRFFGINVVNFWSILGNEEPLSLRQVAEIVGGSGVVRNTTMNLRNTFKDSLRLGPMYDVSDARVNLADSVVIASSRVNPVWQWEGQVGGEMDEAQTDINSLTLPPEEALEHHRERVFSRAVSPRVCNVYEGEYQTVVRGRDVWHTFYETEEGIPNLPIMATTELIKETVTGDGAFLGVVEIVERAGLPTDTDTIAEMAKVLNNLSRHGSKVVDRSGTNYRFSPDVYFVSHIETTAIEVVPPPLEGTTDTEPAPAELAPSLDASVSETVPLSSLETAPDQAALDTWVRQKFEEDSCSLDEIFVRANEAFGSTVTERSVLDSVMNVVTTGLRRTSDTDTGETPPTTPTTTDQRLPDPVTPPPTTPGVIPPRPPAPSTPTPRRPRTPSASRPQMPAMHFDENDIAGRTHIPDEYDGLAEGLEPAERLLVSLALDGGGFTSDAILSAKMERYDSGMNAREVMAAKKRITERARELGVHNPFEPVW